MNLKISILNRNETATARRAGGKGSIEGAEVGTKNFRLSQGRIEMLVYGGFAMRPVSKALVGP